MGTAFPLDISILLRSSFSLTCIKHPPLKPTLTLFDNKSKHPCGTGTNNSDCLRWI